MAETLLPQELAVTVYIPGNAGATNLAVSLPLSTIVPPEADQAIVAFVILVPSLAYNLAEKVVPEFGVR